MMVPVLVAILAAGQVELRRPPAPAPTQPAAKSASQPAAESASQPAAQTAQAAQPELDDAGIRERIETYLGTIDRPATLEQWRALGPRAVPIVAKIALSQERLPTRRAQAVDGLSALGGSTVPAVLRRLARAEAEPLVVRLAAVRGLSRVTAGAKLVSGLRPVLEGARDARVRGLAAQTLAVHAGAQACGAVKAQAGRENEETRVHFEQALARCEAGPRGTP